MVDKIPETYLPKTLSKKDRKTQMKMLKQSRKNYREGKYTSRKKLKSFKSKVSPHIIKAREVYGVEEVKPSKKLSKATGCSIKGLRQIVKKGMGAYYSSGSRPGQTGHSWGYARLGSAITGGKSAAVDFHVLEEHCSPKGKAIKLALKSKKIHGTGRGRVKKVSLKGGKNNALKPIPKKKNGKLYFKDYPEFEPDLTPKEIFQLGSFGGTYWRPIYSNVTKKHYKNQHKKFPKHWWENLSEDKLTSKWEDYDISKNKYNVKVGTTLEFWEKKEWINKENPYGWVQWYCNFYIGKRGVNDEKQIARWNSMKRFLIPLVREIKDKKKDFDDPEVSPKRRQTLQHWGYKLTKKDFNRIVKKHKM